ncbi:MAG TPA: hypothetical protein ENK37_07520 [Oceanithermus profundus]|uniref:DUF4352 domain-containing protein n=1 Tax=Oceanithermus profundus TaxID=187137 RepID=A0A7C4VCX3_9DEIN|nr:hypothetical protein [Oceanithermus profundus]
MKRITALLTLAVLLAACSARTVLVADVDVLSFVDSSEVEGDLAVPGSIDVYVPDADDNLITPDGGQLVTQAPLLDRMSGFAARIAVEVRNDGATDLSVSGAFHLAAASDSANIYDGTDDLKLAEVELTLPAGATQTLELNVELDEDDPALDLLSADGFRVGMAIHASGNGQAHYRIAAFSLVLKARAFDLLPGN